jgi:hypothetical protein
LTTLALASTASAVTLLSDPFQVSANVSDLNFEVSQRQSGTLSPITWTEGGEPIFAQLGNPGSPGGLHLAGRTAGTSGRVSLDRNFLDVPGPGQAFVIELQVDPVTFRPPDSHLIHSWVSVNFGTSAGTRNLFPQFTDGMGVLFTGSGVTEAFDGPVSLGNHPYAAGADSLLHDIRIEIFDPVDGNPFNAGPVTVRAFSDGDATPYFTHTRPSGFANNYISLIGMGIGGAGNEVVTHTVDSLVISLQTPLPEPGTAATLAALAVGVSSRRGGRRSA